MTKVMLVEDDKSLREIYGVRLLAEGYDIVSAGDGEEALAMAIKERPSLIVTDVMMPKISGFDMLDILRSTTETKNIKVIVMTALGSEDQRQRGDQLGADRYLVKSQVGIEDVVRAVHEVLGDTPNPQSQAQPTPQQNAQPAPVQPQPAPAPQQQPQVQAQPVPVPQPVQQNQRTMASVPQPPQPQPQANAAAAPTAPKPHKSTSPMPATGRNRVIQPLNDPSINRVNINELLDRELAKEAGIDMNKRPPIASAEQEKQIVDNQLQQFSNQPVQNQPTIKIDSNGNISDNAAPTPQPTQPAPTQTQPQPATAPQQQPQVQAQPAPAPQPVQQNQNTPPTPPPQIR